MCYIFPQFVFPFVFEFLFIYPTKNDSVDSKNLLNYHSVTFLSLPNLNSSVFPSVMNDNLSTCNITLGKTDELRFSRLRKEAKL